MQAPVFVKINKYKDISSVLNKIQDRIDAANKTIEQLEKVKDEEEQKITEWRESLQAVQEKLEGVSVALHQNK